ncbi:hypothetical protein DY000_02005367 [Brassica cretica]|uniref:DUF287 domain-containing protein n=1 Tax=Brassica cretica TaxID=69181 RepID=A0ABQ7BRS6_BRACR|nr:hypothetical protein DY000_02005367 [Brassica cretica]
MEYKIQKGSNGKRKTEEEQTHTNSLKSKKTNGVACIEVLSKDYFHVYMKELEEILNSGFTKLSSEISSLKAKLNHLDKNFESLKKTMKNDPKTTFNAAESTDSSVEILSITPLKTNEVKTLDKKIKKFGMLLDTSGGMEIRKQVVKSYDPFAVVDHGKDAWLDSWMKIDRNV